VLVDGIQKALTTHNGSGRRLPLPSRPRPADEKNSAHKPQSFQKVRQLASQSGVQSTRSDALKKRALGDFQHGSRGNARFSSRKNAFFTGEIAIFTVASALSESESREVCIQRQVN
jgi:hypothetical protein